MWDITKSYSHTLGEQSQLSFSFLFGWKKNPQTQKKTKNKIQEHLRLTLTKRGKRKQNDGVYVQMHILYISVHPAAVADCTGVPDRK